MDPVTFTYVGPSGRPVHVPHTKVWCRRVDAGITTAVIAGNEVDVPDRFEVTDPEQIEALDRSPVFERIGAATDDQADVDDDGADTTNDEES